MPDCTSHNQRFKSWTNWAMKFCLVGHIHLISCQLITTSSISTTFAGKTLPQWAGSRKCFPTVHWILKHRVLHYRNKQTFLAGKNVLIIMVPILINKDVFEPSYNNLKFMVPNYNYICTNLILPGIWLCILFHNNGPQCFSLGNSPHHQSSLIKI